MESPCVQNGGMFQMSQEVPKRELSPTFYNSQFPPTEVTKAAPGDSWGQTLIQYERTWAKLLGCQPHCHFYAQHAPWGTSVSFVRMPTM